MKTRIASIWILMIVIVGVSTSCYLTAGAIGRDYEWTTGGAELPLVSKIFYPGALLAYLFPIPFLVWATYVSIRPKGLERVLLVIVSSLGTSMLFLALFILAMVMPYMHIIVRPIGER
jgi:hypothetical protein